MDLFGDSLGYQVEPYLDMFFAEAHDYNVTNDTYGGTATCDWLSRMATAAAERPQAASWCSGERVHSVYGRCRPAKPPVLRPLHGVHRRGHRDLPLGGCPCLLGRDPDRRILVAGWDHLDDIYQQLAQADPLTVTYVDAGAAVETPAGGFTWTLPCMSIEPSCGPGGTNVVRSPDGIHFCPDGTPATLGVTGPCDEYSPGRSGSPSPSRVRSRSYPHRASASLVRTIVDPVPGQGLPEGCGLGAGVAGPRMVSPVPPEARDP